MPKTSTVNDPKQIVSDRYAELLAFSRELQALNGVAPERITELRLEMTKEADYLLGYMLDTFPAPKEPDPKHIVVITLKQMMGRDKLPLRMDKMTNLDRFVRHYRDSLLPG